MFELFNGSDENAIAIIKQDHDKVKTLFERFERSDNLREKKTIAAQAIMELKIHAEIEEKIFYPVVRREVEEDIMNEADEEHHVAKMLIAELEQMNGNEDHWEAKFIVLSENIRHHIREEEGEMIPQARRADIDFDMIGRRLLQMKQELKRNGIPMSDEAKLISRSKGMANSPVRAAKRKPSTKVKANKVKSKSQGNYSSGRKSRQTVSRTKTRSSSSKRR
jgi:hypothetical protein